jgi:hypothetical protein
MTSVEKASMLLDYSAMLAAVGRFIAKQHLHSVCVLEFENGLIVTGSVIYTSGDSMRRYTETHVLSFDDLKKMTKEG